ncbi:hypothetical protein QN360_01490 [Glaciimonas sp. CA11.2]|uniref:hypothetical protein n=1 Tax=Glaciimonas sp. CA11.2 TaxID=3048601 RepID=UPI002AB3D5B0|nr:hypothetical protein [Glaciimonas sp. CA11.2]MDY7546156.1 hypothetical protein [Glaciimonas sp. CA11.2]MEB0161578.1 hypothetical protein [Glaciimonas sp. CA11.2]
MKTINDAFPSLALRGLNALGAALLFAGGALSGNSALAQENSLLAAITHHYAAWQWS